MFDASARPQGVMVPRDQLSTGTGEPGAVIAFQRAEMFAVRAADKDGKLQDEIWFRIGGRWCQAPNGVNFAATLKTYRPGSVMATNLDAAYERHCDEAVGAAARAVAAVPKDDAVDPLGGQ